MWRNILFIISLIAIIGFISFAFAQEEPNFGLFSDTFLSIQLGDDPDANEVLTTDGTDNVWSNSLNLQDATVTNTLEVGDVYITSMDGNGTTYRSVNDWFNLKTSAGRGTGGTITAGGGTTIDVAAGTGFIRIADDDISQVKFIDWTASTTIDVDADSIMYVGIDYNSGSPKVMTKYTPGWDLDTQFPLGSVINENINGAESLHILNSPWWITDGLTNVIERFQSFGSVQYDSNVGGLQISVPGTRNIAVTTGKLWTKLNEVDIAAIDTSVSGTVEYYWYNGVAGTWNDGDVSQYSVTQWNDTSLATLQTLNSNWYANIWVYAEADDAVISLLYPQAQYANSASAEAESPPTLLPTHISTHSILIGRIIIKQGDNNPVEIQSAFDTIFNPAQAADHGNLAGLSDDDHTQYLLTNGTRELTGQWSNSNYGIISPSSSSTNYLMVGSGSVDYLDYSGGDLYVSDDLEVDGNATTTGSLYVAGDLFVVNTVEVNSLVNGNSTSTGYLMVGSGWSTNIFNYSAGEAIFSGDLETDGGLHVGTGITSTDSIYSDGGRRNRADDFKSFVVTSSTPDYVYAEYKTATSTWELSLPPYAITVLDINCKTDTSNSGVQCGDGTNMMTYIQCDNSADGVTTVMSSNNTFTAREGVQCEVDSNGGTSNKTTVTVHFKYD